MQARIKLDELPAFDAAAYLDSDEAMATYLTDILQANDAGLLSAALGDATFDRLHAEGAVLREADVEALAFGEGDTRRP